MHEIKTCFVFVFCGRNVLWSHNTYWPYRFGTCDVWKSSSYYMADLGIKGGDDRLNECIKITSLFHLVWKMPYIFLTVTLSAVDIYVMPNKRRNRLTSYRAVYIARQQKKWQIWQHVDQWIDLIRCDTDQDVFLNSFLCCSLAPGLTKNKILKFSFKFIYDLAVAVTWTITHCLSRLWFLGSCWF